MAISRRRALKSIGLAAAAPLLDTAGFSPQAGGLDPQTLAAIADVVLPSDADRPAAIAAFTRWIADYREGADTDHGYGNTRVRTTGPSPAREYPAQLIALETAARAAGALRFAAAGVDQRRAILESALSAAKIERLPPRPNGAHIAADLMGHYFNAPAASDLCYRAEIGRDACRGLDGSEHKPAPRAPRLAPQ